MNKFITGLAGAATVLSLLLPTAQADVKIGIAAEPYPPFAEQNSDGKWIGWELEIIDAVCTAMAEECKIVPVAWDGIIPALLAKKLDVIMASLSITEERQKTIDFSNKYYNTPAIIVADKSSGIDGTPESLKGKIVGVQVSTTHSNYADKHYGEVAQIKYYAQYDEHNQDLVSGRIDAVIADSLGLQPFLSSDSGACCEAKADLTDDAVFGPGVGGGMRKGETELAAKVNAAIQKIREDGTYDAISKKYFDFDIFGG